MAKKSKKTKGGTWIAALSNSEHGADIAKSVALLFRAISISIIGLSAAAMLLGVSVSLKWNPSFENPGQAPPGACPGPTEPIPGINEDSRQSNLP